MKNSWPDKTSTGDSKAITIHSSPNTYDNNRQYGTSPTTPRDSPLLLKFLIRVNPFTYTEQDKPTLAMTTKRHSQDRSSALNSASILYCEKPTP